MEFFKTLLTEYSNENIKCFMVDGSTIRNPLNDPYYQDFTEGDNDAHNPDLVPSGEYWIDLDVAPTEVRATILHELTERRAMIEDGLDYDKAHERANIAEKYGRVHMDEMDDLVAAELALAPAYKSKSMPKVEVKNMPNIVKKILFTHVKQFEGLDRTLDFDASLETPDRMGDQVSADTWKLENYMKNPVFLWCHNYSLPPIGKAIKAWVENGKLVLRIQFADNTIEYPSGMPSADTVYKLYQGGFLNAVSVGFDPSTGDAKSISGGGIDYTGQELLELSAVPVPAHPDALRRAEEAGLITVKQLEVLAPKKKTFSQAEISDEIAYLKTMIDAAGISKENMTEAIALTNEIEKLTESQIVIISVDRYGKAVDQNLIRRLTGGENDKSKVKCNCEGCDVPKCECAGDKCDETECECSCHSNKFIQSFQVKFNENHDPGNGQFTEGESLGRAPITPLTTSRLNAGGSRGVTQQKLDQVNSFKSETIGKIDGLISDNESKISSMSEDKQGQAKQMIRMMKEGRDNLASGNRSYFDSWNSDYSAYQMSNKVGFAQQVMMREASTVWNNKGGLKSIATKRQYGSFEEAYRAIFGV